MAVVCGGAVFQPICGWILAKMWDGGYAQGAPIYTVEAFDLALSTVPLCYLIGLVASMFFIKETYCKPKFDTYLDQLK